MRHKFKSELAVNNLMFCLNQYLVPPDLMFDLIQTVLRLEWASCLRHQAAGVPLCHKPSRRAGRQKKAWNQGGNKANA